MSDKNTKKLIARWWKLREACASDEEMLGLVFMSIQTDTEMGEKLVEDLEHRIGR